MKKIYTIKMLLESFDYLISIHEGSVNILLNPDKSVNIYRDHRLVARFDHIEDLIDWIDKEKRT